MRLQEVNHTTCSECGGPAFTDLLLAEKKDACYYKVKASAKVWPSAYASGRLVQCRKKGADNYGKGKNESVEEDLSRRGFLQGLGMAAAGAAGLGATGAAQARATPDYLAKVERAKALMAKGQSREQTARIMGIKGPNPGGTGPMSGDWGAVNYAAQEMRIKEGIAEEQLDEKCWDTHKQVGMKNKGGRQVPNCVPKESVEENDMNEYNPEYDDEAGMADNNLETLQRAVEGIDDLIQSGDNLPEWCQVSNQ